MVGHGIASAGDASVDLAPGGWLRIDLRFLHQVQWHREHGDTEDKTRLGDEAAFTAIGEILYGESHHRWIDRVDFYTCYIGHAAGQQLLNAIHHLWRVPVRGLRGPLSMIGAPMDPTEPIRAWVTPAAGDAPPRTAFGRVFETSLIEGAGLWSRSVNERLPDDGV